jgi:inorganic triphosphatase YgiF
MVDSKDSLVSSVELELVLMIVSNDPASTLLRISNLTSLADQALVARPTRTLHDIYLDTTDHQLGRERINLRLRGTDGNFWITMKVFPGKFSWKRNERQEVEVPWSRESLGRVARDLEGRGVQMKQPQMTETSSQMDVLRSMGLQVQQDRETERNIREIVEGGSGQVLAELDIDSVLYHFEGQDVRLFEVEIEAKSSGGRRLLREVANDLLAKFESELREWRFGKLVTGRKIEKLWKEGALRDLIDGSTLKPGAFEKIEKA